MIEKENLDLESADRGIPSVAKSSPKTTTAGQKVMLAVCGTLVILALIAVNGGFSANEGDEKKSSKVQDIANHLGAAPDLPPPPPPPLAEEAPEQAEVLQTGDIAPPPPVYQPQEHRDKNAPPTPEERKISSSLLAFGKSASHNRSVAPTAEEQAQQIAISQAQLDASNEPYNESDRSDSLSANLKATSTKGARAGLIADRNMFVTKGTFLDCALETAISSDVAGMTSCRITRDIYSTSGKVLLIERGSRITGQYQGGLKRGKARIFVLWTRIETPTGVIVNIDSAGTDALGRSGHAGYIDSHFWERFGGAIMLSLISDVGTWVSNEATSSQGGNNQIQFGGTADAAQNSASIALENSINIPPTLVKHQGDHISIFVARDLDFRGVYALQAN